MCQYPAQVMQSHGQAVWPRSSGLPLRKDPLEASQLRAAAAGSAPDVTE